MWTLNNKIVTIDNNVADGGQYFTPASLSGLAAWYGSTMNGVARTTLANGTTIVSWQDLSTTEIDLAQIDASRVVTYDSTEDAMYLNGGSNRYGLNRTTPVVSGTTDRTYFSVVKLITATAILTPPLYQDGIAGGTSIARDYETFRYMNGLAQLDTAIAANNWYVVSDIVHTDYGSAESRLNGTAVNNTTTNTSNWNVSGEFHISNSYYSTSWYETAAQAYYREFIAYDRKLSATEITQVEDWLNTKYTIY